MAIISVTALKIFVKKLCIFESVIIFVKNYIDKR